EMLKAATTEFRVIVLDLVMPEMDGQQFLEQLNEYGIEIPCIVQTGQSGIETIVQAMRAGAFDFVVKPVSPERISTAI
ncbi:response regulator, partial [Streptomyces caeruleatus]